MMIDGVKMACEACIRGHRVSGCNHSDRKLLPIAKKGRPVSQCTHCRHMRKSRSAHVKCDCGERLAFQAKNGGKAASAAGATGCQAGAAVPAAADENGDAKAPASSASAACNCCIGARCTCSSKKEQHAQHPQHHLDSVPEFAATATCTTTATAAETRKPRLPMTQSETSLTTFANGHHRPTHKHHNSVHGSAPYTIPQVGHTGHTFGEHNGCTKTTSVSAPPTATSQKPRRIKSEQSSPDLRIYPALPMPTGITPLELTPQPQHPAIKPVSVSRTANRVQPGLSVNTNHPPFTMHDFTGQDLLGSADSDTAYQFSAGLFPPQSAGWPSSFGHFDNSTFDEPPHLESAQFEPQHLDLEQFLRLSLPGLGNSTSGDEVDEFIPPINGPSPLSGNGTANGVLSSGSSDQADSDNYRLSAASSCIGLQQAGMLSGADELEIDKYLAQSMAPAQQNESFDANLMLGTGSGVGGGRHGIGLYGDYADSYLTPKEIGTKTGDLSALAAAAPQATDDDVLWMTAWSNNVHHGAPPTDPSWNSS